MEQTGTKKKFRFNIVDVIIILAVLIVIAGICYKLFAPLIQAQVSPTVETDIVMRIRGAMPYMVEELEKDPDLLNDQYLVAGSSYETNAKVTSFEIVDYIVQLPTDEGDIAVANDPQKKDVLVYVTATVQDAPVLKVANQELRVGRTFILKTKRYEGLPTIDSITLK